MLRALSMGIALALVAGCAEVQLSRREPPPGCRPLEALEVRSGGDEPPSQEALRAYAGERHSDYVVVDSFSIFDENGERGLLTRARLFRCNVE